MINPIVIFETVAMILYIVAIWLCMLGFRRSPIDIQIVFALIILGMFMAAFASLSDVFQWSDVEPLKTVALFLEQMEEIFTPFFGLFWIIAARIAMRRMGKRVTKA